jgi:hypothetical protein
METVYEANLAVDAYIIRDLLERAGVPAQVAGEHLQSGVGELPMSQVRVVVHPDHADEARRIIAEWERQTPTSSGTPPGAASSRWSWAPFTFVIGGAMGFVAAWAIFNTPVTSDAIDYDGDGIDEETFHYAGEKLSRIDFDRNGDRRVDGRWLYDHHGLATRWQGDDDFDGRFEITAELERGQFSAYTVDREGDGRPNAILRYRNGIVTERDLLDPDGRVVKRQRYDGDRLVAAEVDADGDGQFERKIEYDELEEPRT